MGPAEPSYDKVETSLSTKSFRDIHAGEGDAFDLLIQEQEKKGSISIWWNAKEHDINLAMLEHLIDIFGRITVRGEEASPILRLKVINDLVCAMEAQGSTARPWLRLLSERVN